MLDIAREQVAVDADEASRSTEPDSTNPAELPAPDPSSYEGLHRVVNLFAPGEGDGDEPTAIDVWARRTFTHGPALLAEGIGVGETSTTFAAPVGAPVVIVSSGAGPDGGERAALPELIGDERATTVFTNDDRDVDGAASISLYEHGTDLAPAPPDDEHGLVIVVDANLGAFDEELSASVGGAEFLIGDGSPVCRTQRVEATGIAPDALGAAERIEFETAPGPASISLHPVPSLDGCDRSAVAQATVDVAAGETVVVLVYTLDGTGLSTLTVPTG